MNGPIVLSIGTTHPWNVAGVGRDLTIGSELSARVFTAVAAVSAQDARGVRALQSIAGDVFAAQLQALPWAAAGAVRVGALATAENAALVATMLRAHPDTPAVVDPVFAASQGGDLADAAARAAVRDELAVLPAVILTPNLDEAALLLGVERVRPRVDCRGGAGASTARSAGGAGEGRPSRTAIPRTPLLRRPESNCSPSRGSPRRCAAPAAPLRWSWPANSRAVRSCAMPSLAARTYVRAKLAAH